MRRLPAGYGRRELDIHEELRTREQFKGRIAEVQAIGRSLDQAIEQAEAWACAIGGPDLPLLDAREERAEWDRYLVETRALLVREHLALLDEVAPAYELLGQRRAAGSHLTWTWRAPRDELVEAAGDVNGWLRTIFGAWWLDQRPVRPAAPWVVADAQEALVSTVDPQGWLELPDLVGYGRPRQPRFGLLHPGRQRAAWTERRCQVCGERNGGRAWMVLAAEGPVEAGQVWVKEPPMHRRCLSVALLGCPEIRRRKPHVIVAPYESFDLAPCTRQGIQTFIQASPRDIDELFSVDQALAWAEGSWPLLSLREP